MNIAVIRSQEWGKGHISPFASNVKLLFYVFSLTEYVLYIIIVGWGFCTWFWGELFLESKILQED